MFKERTFKGALDKYNIIPLTFSKKKKKVGIFYRDEQDRVLCCHCNNCMLILTLYFNILFKVNEYF